MLHQAGEVARATGRFVFYSHDNKFIIKSMTAREFKIYNRELGRFHHHYSKYPMSMIARIYGVYTVDVASFGKHHFMLMENTLRAEFPDVFRGLFELNGGDPDVRFVKGSHNRGKMMKDSNFLATMEKHPNLIKFAPAV